MDALNPQLANSVLSALAGILGVIAAILGLRRYKRRAGLRYGKWTLNLATNAYPVFSGSTRDTILKDAEFRYQGVSAERLTVTRIVLWNAGPDLLDESEVARANPVCIRGKDSVNILDVRILKASDRGANLRIERLGDSSAEVKFDYLESKGGGILEVVHTGYRSSDIKVEGSVRGRGEISEPHLRDFSGVARVGAFLGSRPRILRVAFAVFTGFFLYIFVTAAWQFLDYKVYYDFMVKNHAAETIPLRYVGAIVLLSFMAMTIFGRFWFYVTRKPTKNLREFEQTWGSALG